MNGTFRQSMSWLHTWAGLVLGWLLYFMFLTGSAGYFDEEITHWMQPELIQNQTLNQTQLLAVAEARLGVIAPENKTWWVDFPIGREYSLSIWWKGFIDSDNKGGRKWQHEVLNTQTGKPIPVRETAGGSTLYIMHYALHYIPQKVAYWLTSLSTMFMLIGLITGIVIHKNIFKDFFTFRPGKKQRSWLDMHNVLSVFPLPFHLMITYSGLILLMFTTMPNVINASYGTSKENQAPFFDTVFYQGAHPEDSNVLVKGIAMSSLLPNIQERWGHNQMADIGLEGRGTEGAHIEVRQQGYSGFNPGAKLRYHAVSGELLHDSMHQRKPPVTSKQFYDLLSGLHEGLFAGTILRWLYFLSGLMGAGMIATGMILWSTKRRKKSQKSTQNSKGLILVEYLNAGTIIGLPIGIAVYFWANRLIPAGFDGREDWEVHSLFIAWAISLTYPLLIRSTRPIKYVWRELLTVAALLYTLLPVLNFFTANRHLGNSLRQADWVMAGFDICMLCFGAAFGIAAIKVQYKQLPITAKNRKSSQHINLTDPTEGATS